jgi:hypothetical protein
MKRNAPNIGSSVRAAIYTSMVGGGDWRIDRRPLDGNRSSDAETDAAAPGPVTARSRRRRGASGRLQFETMAAGFAVAMTFEPKSNSRIR